MVPLTATCQTDEGDEDDQRKRRSAATEERIGRKDDRRTIGGREDRRTIAEERIGGPSADKKIGGQEDRRTRRSVEETIGGRSADDQRTIGGQSMNEKMMKISARPVATGRTSLTGGTGLTGFNGFQRGICLNGLKYSTDPFSGSGLVQPIQPTGPGRVQKH
ncbi:hypothetical protein SLEP1_g3242 [Rubroshorea leprosula]|uniref:Uncharacterized protein n=1 Tax=Rubroshorea leprosula TaxID=152421 RepID=A0AAV5HP31_9ROSI|nr:hypothetical protein SLEP1_g3242 [Rubroshorea leprosula]